METGIIPPNINYESPRKELSAVIEGRIKIITEPILWEGGYVGINSFGFGGGNCHVLLKSNPKEKVINDGAPDDLPKLIVVSGRTEEAVKTLLNDVRLIILYLFESQITKGIIIKQNKFFYRGEVLLEERFPLIFLDFTNIPYVIM